MATNKNIGRIAIAIISIFLGLQFHENQTHSCAQGNTSISNETGKIINNNTCSEVCYQCHMNQTNATSSSIFNNINDYVSNNNNTHEFVELFKEYPIYIIIGITLCLLVLIKDPQHRKSIIKFVTNRLQNSSTCPRPVVANVQYST